MALVTPQPDALTLFRSSRGRTRRLLHLLRTNARVFRPNYTIGAPSQPAPGSQRSCAAAKQRAPATFNNLSCQRVRGRQSGHRRGAKRNQTHLRLYTIPKHRGRDTAAENVGPSSLDFRPGRTKSGPKNAPGFRAQKRARNPAPLIGFVYEPLNRGPNFGAGIRARFWDRILFAWVGFRRLLGPESGLVLGTGFCSLGVEIRPTRDRAPVADRAEMIRI